MKNILIATCALALSACGAPGFGWHLGEVRPKTDKTITLIAQQDGWNVWREDRRYGSPLCLAAKGEADRTPADPYALEEIRQAAVPYVQVAPWGIEIKGKWSGGGDWRDPVTGEWRRMESRAYDDFLSHDGRAVDVVAYGVQYRYLGAGQTSVREGTIDLTGVRWAYETVQSCRGNIAYGLQGM